MLTYSVMQIKLIVLTTYIVLTTFQKIGKHTWPIRTFDYIKDGDCEIVVSFA